MSSDLPQQLNKPLPRWWALLRPVYVICWIVIAAIALVLILGGEGHEAIALVFAIVAIAALPSSLFLGGLISGLDQLGLLPADGPGMAVQSGLLIILALGAWLQLAWTDRYLRCCSGDRG